MKISDVLIYQLNTPWLFIIVCVQFTTAFCLLFQYKMQGKQNLGWNGDDKFSRFLMLIVSACFIITAISLSFEKTVSIRVIFLSFAMCAWRINAVIKYLASSHRHAERNLQAVEVAKIRAHARSKI